MLSHKFINITDIELVVLISQIKHNFSCRSAITLIEKVSATLEQALFNLCRGDFVFVTQASTVAVLLVGLDQSLPQQRHSSLSGFGGVLVTSHFNVSRLYLLLDARLDKALPIFVNPLSLPFDLVSFVC